MTRDGAQLFAQASGQAREEILPSSDIDFFMRAADVQLSFARDRVSTTVTGLILHQGGQDTPARKLK